MFTKFQFRINETIRKNRLDEFVADEITAVSKMFLRNAIKKGDCKVNGSLELRGGYHLKANDMVEIEIDLEATTAMKPENISLDVVFEDTEMIVVNKPAGMLVHPTLGQKSGTLLNALAFYFNGGQQDNFAIGDSQSAFVRPGLIHRLDRETSGLTVVAKTKRAHRILSEHFQRRLVEKEYLALVEGNIETDSGEISAPLGRFDEEKRWGVKEDGKSAETFYRVKERFSETTLVSLVPVTGRTNQLRIHCAYIGHPIIGDKLYAGREFSRLCLHAAKLSFRHPNGGERMKFMSQVCF